MNTLPICNNVLTKPHDRDESNYALKEALVEVEKYKNRLKIAESLIGTEKSQETNNKSLITPISVGITTILAIMIFAEDLISQL